MILRDPGWLRPVLALALAVLGVVLRFLMPTKLGAFGLKRFRTRPDEDLFLTVRARLGDMLLLWAAWLVFQIFVGMKESWVTSVWAPLTIVAALIPAHFARLYALRHLPTESTVGLGSGCRPWIWIFLRETVPLGAVLASILIVKEAAPSLPESIPTGWDWRQREFIWTPREIGLDILRHRTMVVYGVLLGLEGAYLIIRWALGRAVDVSREMLSPRLWLFYLFRTGWILLFAGFNLALIDRARDTGPGWISLVPGLTVLAALGILTTRTGSSRSRTPPGTA